MKTLEKNTKDQSNSEFWSTERKARVTSSNFEVTKKRNPNRFKITKIDLQNESITVNKYVEKKD